MLNEKKVSRMTRTALYERKAEKALRISKFRKRDYVWLQVMKILFAVTIAWVIIVAIGFFAWIQLSSTAVNPIDLFRASIAAGAAWIVILIVNAVISVHIYRERYDAAVNKKEHLQKLLGHLNYIYEKETGKDG